MTDGAARQRRPFHPFPTAFEPALADRLQALGTVRHLDRPPVPLRPHWRVVAGVSGADCLGLSAHASVPLAGHRCAFR